MEATKGLLDYLAIGLTAIACITIVIGLYISFKQARRAAWTTRRRP